MKALNKFLGIALIALGVLSVTSCADENDWGINSAFDRLFGVGNDNLSVETTESTATVTFSAMKATEDSIYFVIEVSKDSLYDEVPMGGENSYVYGQNKEIKSSPYTITGLESDTKYYLRIKTSSDTKADSKWVYYNDGGTFKTKAEQIFNEVPASNIGEDHVLLTWQPGAEVTLLTVATADGTIVQEIDLEQYPDAIEKGEYDVTGLEASTDYTFVIYNGETKRGTLKITTAAAMPDGDYKVDLSKFAPDATAIDEELMTEIITAAKAATGKDNPTLTIGVPGGKTMSLGTEDEGLNIPDGCAVTFFGLAGEKPKLNLYKNLEFNGAHEYIRFNNVDLVNDGSGYFVNQGSSCEVGELTLDGVNADGFTSAFLRFKDSDTKSLDKLIINNCIISNQKSQVIYFKEEKTTLKELTITNSTFNTFDNTFIQTAGSAGDVVITINACTFYNVIGGGKYLIDANGAGDINISNTIFAKTYSDTAKGIRQSGTGEIKISQVYFTSDFKLSSNAFSPDLTNTPVPSEEIFEDAENGDFTITDKELSVLGDPRWFPTEE